MFALGGYLGSFATSLAAYCACQACQCASREVLTQSARVAWSVLFFLAMVVAWILRDFAKPMLENIPCRCMVLCCCCLVLLADHSF